MKIGFDAKRLYNNFTGLGNHSRTTIDILTEYFPENAYFLYTPKLRRNPVTDLYMANSLCKTVLPHGMVKGGLWRTFGIPSELQRDGIDLFHGLSNELPVGIRNSGVPSVVTIHDVAFHTFPDMYHWFDCKIYDRKWCYAVKNADRIIAISECTKRDILRFYDVDESKIDVVYQPVAPRFYKEMEVMDESSVRMDDYLLYVGSINSRKNLLGIIRAIEMLPKDLQIPLVVVGGGREYKAEVQKYIAQHNLNKLVVFPDHRVGDDELISLYRNATAFVYPSFYEGFGLPVVEALLCGCPVVTSNVSSLPEAGGPYSLQADPASIDDIAEKIKTVLTDDEQRKRLSQGGYDYAMNTFHPKVLAGKLMDTYEKILE